tara:strand:- start:3219 stop:3791 length:573 start_codon:yes stop_codon:yes gene_type:complete
MAIENKHYAAFFLDVEEITDIDGNLIQLNIDFQEGISDPYTLDEISEKEVFVEDYEELRSKLHLPKEKHKGEKVKQLRDNKGKFLSKSESKLIKDLSKKQKKSVKKIRDTYFKDKSKLISKVEGSKFAQHDVERAIGETSTQMNVNITTFDGDTYSYSGIGSDIVENPDFIQLFNREMNRVYKTIQKENK